jgi:hypothetical protein
MQEIEFDSIDSNTELKQALELIRRTGSHARICIPPFGSHLIQFLNEVIPVQSLRVTESEMHLSVPGLSTALEHFLERVGPHELVIGFNDFRIPVPSRPVSIRVLRVYWPDEYVGHRQLPDFIRACVHSLETLELHGFEKRGIQWPLPEIFRVLRGAVHLRELTLGRIAFDHVPGLRELGELIPTLPELEHLQVTESLYECTETVVPLLWEPLRGHLGLTRLSILYEDVGAAQLPEFTSVLLSLPKLRTLNLNPDNGSSLDFDEDEDDLWTPDDARVLFNKLLSKPKLEIIPNNAFSAILDICLRQVLLVVLASAKSRVGQDSWLQHIPTEHVRMLRDFLFGDDEEEEEMQQ